MAQCNIFSVCSMFSDCSKETEVEDQIFDFISWLSTTNWTRASSVWPVIRWTFGSCDSKMFSSFRLLYEQCASFCSTTAGKTLSCTLNRGSNNRSSQILPVKGSTDWELSCSQYVIGHTWSHSKNIVYIATFSVNAVTICWRYFWRYFYITQ